MPKRQHARQTSHLQAAAIKQAPSPATLTYKPRTPQPAPSTTSPPRPNILLRHRSIALFVAGAALASIPVYAGFTYTAYVREASAPRAHPVPLDVSDRYDRNAGDYDASVDRLEWLMGITRLRRQLAGKARGHVLEASAGTGRNMAYYPLPSGRIKSVTLVDRSAAMVTVARIKWAKTNAYFTNALFRVQDARDKVWCPAPSGYFDTVVQTMGVCSTPEPEAVLRNLGEMVDPERGRVLLLEHGRSHYGWLNDVLDKIAPGHADRHGCWFNKDVGEIVEKSGLEVVEAKRYHFGTTWWFELKPKPRPKPVVVEKLEIAGAGDAAGTKRGSWWWT